jgi:addiction module HigA family antidote
MYRYEREPTSPGEILLEEFLIPLGITQKMLSDHLGCDYKVVNRIINGKASISPKIAVKLAQAFETSPEFWLNAQTAVDIWKISQLHKDERRILSLLPDTKVAIV